MWEKSLVHSPFLIERQTNILVCRFLFIMVKTHSAQHNIALVMLSVTALVWGAGFLLSDLLLQNGFADAPFTLNALRFAIAAILLALVFCTKVRFNRQTLLYGSVGGVLLFGGFALQLLGLKYTTPAACGFFTASYTLFVPFLVWILFKKRPTFMTMAGVIFALAGLLILNTNSSSLTADRETLLGNMITLGGSLFFAMQIIWVERAMGKGCTDSVSLTFIQVAVCAVTFALASLIFEGAGYASLQINFANCWWQIAIISVVGTAFAYFAQTYAQSKLSPTETSVLIGCESPVGAILSVSLGLEPLTWQICVGGALVLVAVVLIEILPTVINKKTAHGIGEQSPSQQEDLPQSAEEERRTNKKQRV